jgi:hypothetical protein
MSSTPVLRLKELDRVSLELVLNSSCRALRVPDFSPSLSVAELGNMGALEQLGRYDSQRYSSNAFRFGPTLNEHRAPKGIATHYWSESVSANAVWAQSVTATRFRRELVGALRLAWKGSVTVAKVNGRDLFWGIVREISQGTLTHWDDITREYPSDFMDETVTGQLAFNLFLSVPSTGGSTAIYNRRDAPEDEKHRVGFGYSSAVTQSMPPPVTISPQLGEIVVFDPRYLHEVYSSVGGRRISFSFFAGVTRSGLVLWS